MKHDWKALHKLWKTFDISKKEFAAQRGLPYQPLIIAFRKVERSEDSKRPSAIESHTFAKVEVAQPVDEMDFRKIVIVTSNGTRLEVPV